MKNKQGNVLGNVLPTKMTSPLCEFCNYLTIISRPKVREIYPNVHANSLQAGLHLL